MVSKSMSSTIVTEGQHSMRAFRVLGAVFCVFGCFFALLGILTSLLPMIENEQFQLIVESFQETSADPLTNTLNAIVMFCLHSGYFLLFSGISLTVAGGLISSSANKHRKESAAAVSDVPVARKESPEAGVPKPAYYPGGLTPPVVSLTPETEEETPHFISTMGKQKAAPIVGGVEPALSAEEDDAMKLIRNDEQLASQAQYARSSAPDYSQYISNNEPADTDPQDSAKAHPSQGQQKPRIVSTMGKNKR